MIYSRKYIGVLIRIFFVAFLLLSLYKADAVNQRQLDSTYNHLIYLVDHHSTETIIDLTLVDISNSLIGNDLPFAINYLKKCLVVVKNAKLSSSVSSCYYLLGWHYARHKMFDLALESYLISYRILVEAGNESAVGFILMDIGNVYYALSNYEVASSFYKRSLVVFEKEGNAMGLATTLNNLGLIRQEKKQYDSAYYYYNKALLIRKTDPGLRKQKYLTAHSISYIACVYLDEKQYPRAINAFEEAFSYLKADTGADTRQEKVLLMASCYISMGKCYQQMGEDPMMFRCFSRADSIATVLKDNKTITEVYKALTEYYINNKDFESARKEAEKLYHGSVGLELLESKAEGAFYLSVALINDKIHSFGVSRNLAEIDAALDAVNYEKESENMQSRARLQRIEILSLIIFLLLISLFYLGNYYIKQRNIKRLNELSNSTFEGIFIHEKGKVLDCNEKVVEMLGIPRADIVGQQVYKFMPEEYFTRVQRVIESPKTEIYTIELVRSDGSRFYAEVLSKPMEYLGRTGRVAAVRDVSESVTASEKLKLSEERYRFLAENMADVLCQLDPDLKVTYISPSVVKLIGIEPHKVLNNSLLAFVKPDDRERAKQELEKMLASFQHNPETDNQVVELLFSHPSGKDIWAEFLVTPVFDAKKHVSLYQGVIRNITKRKVLEFELKEQQRYVATLLSNLPGMVYRCRNDRDWTMEFASEGTLELTGYLPEDFIHNRKLTFNDIVDPASRDYLWEKWQRILPMHEVFEDEYKITTADGKMKWVWERGRGIYGPDGEVLSLEGFITDITAKKEDEQKLLEKNAELEEANATRNKFFSIIGHDLKNPLHAIMGFSELLSDEYDNFTDEDRKRFIHNIKDVGDGLQKLLQNLLDWARIQVGHMEFQPENTYISLMMKESMNMLNEQAVAKNITIRSEIPPQITANVDRNMVQVIIRNLISNGIKFSNPGQTVVVKVSKVNQQLIISVKDEGVGISSQDLDKLFSVGDKFRREGTMQEKGTGLGLILCKEFVEIHKGKIWVESEDGKGCTFYVSLPT
ncbi:MAG: PAS domain S-box protein [Bacteroidetes bacterium]|nr:PAS domain S-box protein [Bacteroidota bacterium]